MFDRSGTSWIWGIWSEAWSFAFITKVLSVHLQRGWLGEISRKPCCCGGPDCQSQSQNEDTSAKGNYSCCAVVSRGEHFEEEGGYRIGRQMTKSCVSTSHDRMPEWALICPLCINRVLTSPAQTPRASNDLTELSARRETIDGFTLSHHGCMRQISNIN